MLFAEVGYFEAWWIQLLKDCFCSTLKWVLDVK